MNVEEIRGLRESTTPWQMSLRVAPRKSDPMQRYRVLLIVSPGANTIRHLEAVEGEPTPRLLERALARAMVQAPDSHMPPARPPAVMVDDDALAETIAPRLHACGVQVQRTHALPAIDPVMARLAEEEALFSNRPRPTLVAAPEVPPEPAEPVDDALPYLIPFEHAVCTAEVTPALLGSLVPGLEAPVRALVLCCEEALAPAMAACLGEVDTLAFARMDDDEGSLELVLGLAGERVLGAVTVCPFTDDRLPLRLQLADDEATETLIVVAKGAPGKLRRPAIVAVREVCLARTAAL